MAKEKFTGKVISQDLFYGEFGTKVEVPTVTIQPDTSGFYYITPIGNTEHTREWLRGWEELEIKKVEDGLYHLFFYAVSTQHIRSDEPFLVIEMTMEQVCHWHKNDVWFAEDIHYIVRRKGKKITGTKGRRRCIKCRYLQNDNATVCDRGC